MMCGVRRLWRLSNGRVFLYPAGSRYRNGSTSTTAMRACAASSRAYSPCCARAARSCSSHSLGNHMRRPAGWTRCAHPFPVLYLVTLTPPPPETQRNRQKSHHPPGRLRGAAHRHRLLPRAPLRVRRRGRCAALIFILLLRSS